MQENDDGVLHGVSFESSASLDEIIGLRDTVSYATNLEVTLVKGEKLKVGAHLDLVCSFEHSMKEYNDEAIKRGRVFVDNEAAMVEAGELVGTFKKLLIEKEDIVANLVDLATGDNIGSTNSEEITMFKSVDSAFVDMLAAQLVYETYTRISK